MAWLALILIPFGLVGVAGVAQLRMETVSEGLPGLVLGQAFVRLSIFARNRLDQTEQSFRVPCQQFLHTARRAEG